MSSAPSSSSSSSSSFGTFLKSPKRMGVARTFSAFTPAEFCCTRSSILLVTRSRSSSLMRRSCKTLRASFLHNRISSDAVGNLSGVLSKSPW